MRKLNKSQEPSLSKRWVRLMSGRKLSSVGSARTARTHALYRSITRRRASARLLETRVICARREGIVVMVGFDFLLTPVGRVERSEIADISIAYVHLATFYLIRLTQF